MPDLLTQFLPDSMFRSVELLPKNNQPVVLLTRHSLRELADSNGFASYKLPLTQTGRELAFDWGKWLAQNTHLQLAACLSSPISRCVDTASLMLQGIQSTQNTDTTLLTIEQHNLLVEPGSFVLDIAQAGPHFKRQGALRFINCFLRQQLPGMKLPVMGAQDILRLLFEHLPQQDNRLLLAVSHDTILAALFAIMHVRTTINQQDWPDMMEGAFIWFEGEAFESSIVHWVWRGQHYQFRVTKI